MLQAAMDITMHDTALLRLFQLISPSLPTGGFSYSQGIEWAVEAGWIQSRADLQHWLEDLLEHAMSQVDIPILRRMYAACEQGEKQALVHWSEQLLAWRETSELRLEEQNRGRALAILLRQMEVGRAAEWYQSIALCQLAGYALAAVTWNIPVRQAAAGYVWSWLENQVLAGIKIIPLGQTAGQQILFDLAGRIPAVVGRGLELEEQDIGSAMPALALSCCGHEMQYTRLYRS
ncbi:urease accessory protein UreF [Desulfolithobacter sp.]